MEFKESLFQFHFISQVERKSLSAQSYQYLQLRVMIGG